MRLLYTFSFVLYFVTTSIGQSFTMPELIKMSKMDIDSFDTYVSSKGYVFFEEKNDSHRNGVTYAFKISSFDKLAASKFITLNQRYFDKKYSIVYQTVNRKDYLNIKNSIKILGFKLQNTEVIKSEGSLSASNHFEYKKGKAEIDLFSSSEEYEISFSESY